MTLVPQIEIWGWGNEVGLRRLSGSGDIVMTSGFRCALPRDLFSPALLPSREGGSEPIIGNDPKNLWHILAGIAGKVDDLPQKNTERSRKMDQVGFLPLESGAGMLRFSGGD
jgi:hypothetical protein